MHKNGEQNGVFIFVLSRNFLAEVGFRKIREICAEWTRLSAVSLRLTQAG
jgi:hypothetical protein